MKLTKRTKRNNIGIFALSFVILIAINIIGNFVFQRFDLTSEKRYSLSSATKNMIQDLDDYVYVKVYLSGSSLPPDYKSLSNGVKEILDEFRAYNSNIQYEFIDPTSEDDKTKRRSLFTQLAEEGLAYYNVPVETNDGFAQKIVFTSALVTYKGKSAPLNFLSRTNSIPTTQDINNSIQNLELNFNNVIRKLSSKRIARIGFSEDHGEVPDIEIHDIAAELSQSYSVQRVALDEKINSLVRRIEGDSTRTEIKRNLDLLIIAKPDSTFSERNLFLIDQFIMHGGKVIWALDLISASMDSLRDRTTTLGMAQLPELQQMLFKYGARINSDLLLNQNALEIGTGEGKLRPWDYFPIALPLKGHPITNNLNAVKTQFVSSIDLVGDPGIKKTVLLQTDQHTRIQPSPVLIDVVDIIYKKPRLDLYKYPPMATAVLLEGEFTSIYKNRMIDPRISGNKDFGIKGKSDSTQMLIISDGDIIRNQVIQGRGQPMALPLGYDRFTKRFFGNKKFLMNAINYMLGDDDLIELRNKEFKIRLLNKEKINKNKIKWQILNIAAPIGLILMLATVLLIRKRRRYI